MEKQVILKKQEDVKSTVEKINKSKAVIAFNYQGLTVEKFMQLRNDLRQKGCEICVLKNNITRRAATECGYVEFADALTGPKAVIFSYEDVVSPAKGIFEFAKQNEKISIADKGIVDGIVFSYSQLEELATLPSYETLLTQLAAGMLGTVRQLAVGLNMLCEQEA